MINIFRNCIMRILTILNSNFKLALLIKYEFHYYFKNI